MNQVFVRPGFSESVHVSTGSQVRVEISGTFVATINVERQVNGNEVDKVTVHSFTAPGVFESEVAGIYRLHCSSFSSGAAIYDFRSDAVPDAGGDSGAVYSVAGKTGDVVLTKSDVGLSVVDNTSDSLKPVSTAVASALAQKAPLDSPTLTGTPTAPTAAQSVNTTQIATTAYVKAAVSALVNSSPTALDTLKELSDALGADANFAATMTSALAAKANVTPSSTWAARGTGTVVGQRKIITDIGPPGGVTVAWDGTYWRLTTPVDIVFDITAATNAASTAELIAKQATLPAGLLRAFRSFTVGILFGKTGVTDAATAIKLRMGSAGTTSDTQIFTFSGLNASLRSGAYQVLLGLTDATTLRILGTQNASEDWSGTSLATVAPATFTIADADANAIILSASVQMAGTTNQGQVHHLIVTASP